MQHINQHYFMDKLRYRLSERPVHIVSRAKLLPDLAKSVLIDCGVRCLSHKDLSFLSEEECEPRPTVLFLANDTLQEHLSDIARRKEAGAPPCPYVISVGISARSQARLNADTFMQSILCYVRRWTWAR